MTIPRKFLATDNVDLLPWSVWRLVSGENITTVLHLSLSEVLRGLRNCLNKDRPGRDKDEDRPECHSTDGRKNRKVEKGGGPRSVLRSRDRFTFDKTDAVFESNLCEAAENEWR